jgi:GNAT superfamily N-acetyltransferase
MAAHSDTLASLARLRSGGSKGVTNLYPGAASEMAQTGNFELIEARGSLLFLKHDRDFDRLYFSAESATALSQALDVLPASHRECVCDVIGTVPELAPTCAALSGCGFSIYQEFQRMSLLRGHPSEQRDSCDTEIQIVEAAQSSEIHRLLSTHFDARSEHIPTLPQVMEIVDSRSVLLAKQKGVSAGILLHSKTGLTTTLRFLLVLPCFRNMGISSKLLIRYFEASASCKRFLLWVRAGNEPAIRLYLRHEYRPDGIIDQVLWRARRA